MEPSPFLRNLHEDVEGERRRDIRPEGETAATGGRQNSGQNARRGKKRIEDGCMY